MVDKKTHRAGIIFLLLCPIDLFLSWFAVTHFKDPFNEISLFAISFAYIGGGIFVAAKAGIHTFRETQKNQENLPHLPTHL